MRLTGRDFRDGDAVKPSLATCIRLERWMPRMEVSGDVKAFEGWKEEYGDRVEDFACWGYGLLEWNRVHVYSKLSTAHSTIVRSDHKHHGNEDVVRHWAERVVGE
ncbi:hypothetical protein HK101_006750, partial [Irineochytrium annulatum]